MKKLIQATSVLLMLISISNAEWDTEQHEIIIKKNLHMSTFCLARYLNGVRSGMTIDEINKLVGKPHAKKIVSDKKILLLYLFNIYEFEDGVLVGVDRNDYLYKKYELWFNISGTCLRIDELDED